MPKPDRTKQTAVLKANRFDNTGGTKERVHTGVLERRSKQVISYICAGIGDTEIVHILGDPALNTRSAPVTVSVSAIEKFRRRNADLIDTYRAKMDEELFEDAIHVKSERMRRYEAMDRALATIHGWVVDGRPDPTPEEPERRVRLPEGFVAQVVALASTRARILRMVAEEQGDLPRRLASLLVGERGEVREDGAAMIPTVTETMTVIYEREYSEGLNVRDIG